MSERTSIVERETPLAKPRSFAVSTMARLSAARKSASSASLYTTYAAQRVGKAGIVGISLFIFSIATYVTGNIPAHRTIQEQTASLEVARVGAKRQQTDSGMGAETGKAVRFLRELPTVDDVPNVMGKIVAIAAATGIELERGNYEYIVSDSSSIARYEMALPVVGTYPDVRRFVENVLADVPSIALERMRIERGKVTDQTISADLHFTMLLGVAP